MGPWTPLQKKALVFMLAAVLLWLTDFIHQIPPSVIGLGVGLLAVVPTLGVLDIGDMKKMNYLPVFFVGTTLSMGNVLVQTKALTSVANVMFSWMEPLMHNSFTATAMLYWTAFVYHFFLGNEISMLGTSMPLLLTFAKSHGLSPFLTGMVWAFGAGGKIFLYQSTPTIVGYSYGYFQPKDLLRMGFALTVVEFAILVLLVPFYWPIIGIR
jgi:di/tricarboxylate transporter